MFILHKSILHKKLLVLSALVIMHIALAGDLYRCEQIGKNPEESKENDQRCCKHDLGGMIERNRVLYLKRTNRRCNTHVCKSCEKKKGIIYPPHL